jgi:hypothetical protein
LITRIPVSHGRYALDGPPEEARAPEDNPDVNANVEATAKESGRERSEKVEPKPELKRDSEPAPTEKHDQGQTPEPIRNREGDWDRDRDRRREDAKGADRENITPGWKEEVKEETKEEVKGDMKPGHLMESKEQEPVTGFRMERSKNRQRPRETKANDASKLADPPKDETKVEAAAETVEDIDDDNDFPFDDGWKCVML